MGTCESTKNPKKSPGKKKIKRHLTKTHSLRDVLRDSEELFKDLQNHKEQRLNPIIFENTLNSAVRVNMKRERQGPGIVLASTTRSLPRIIT